MKSKLLNCAACTLVLSTVSPNRSEPQHAESATRPGNVVAQGTLVCLDRDLAETACSTKNTAYGLKTEEARIYPLKNHENVNALFVEKRLKSPRFQLTLRHEPGSQLYALVRSQFIRDGKLYDFHYFCDVCNITTYAPGLCMCCREETEYRESPAQ